MHRVNLIALAAAWVMSIAISTPVHGESTNGANAFNWYYATAFGTGVYRVGEVNVATVTLPFAHRLRQTTADQWGIRLLLPLTVGGADTNDGGGIPGVPNQLASVAFVPGIAFERQLRPNWIISPYLNVGIGREFLQGSSAEIVVAGIKSRYFFPLAGHDAYLGNALVYSHTSVSRGSNDSLALFVAGLNAALFDGPDVGGRTTRFWGHTIYYGYFNNLEFVLPGSRVVALRNELELAVSLAPRNPWDVLGFDLEAVGLGYRFGNGTKGINLFTSFPF